MQMQDTLFYILAFLPCVWLLVIAIHSAAVPSPVRYSWCDIVSLAGLFVLLHASFLAAVQVLVTRAR